jgi:hypothetical protein
MKIEKRSSSKPLICAYYFPNWHSDPKNEQWHGKGWTEWEVLKCARPRFPGHRQPLTPLWGYEDESKVEVMNRKINTAVAYGIDCFIFDWYYYQDGPYRNRCLDEGFLASPDNEKLKFSVMWCNHNAIQAHPTSRMFPTPVLCSGEVSAKTFFNATEHCIKHYFNRPNYMRVADGLYFSIYRLTDLVVNLGGVVKTRELLDDFRARVRKSGYGELHISAVGIEEGSLLPLENSQSFSGTVENNAVVIASKLDGFLEALGINSRSGHAWTWNKPDFPTCDYETVANLNMAKYARFTSDFKLPYNPAVCVGWDPSPRTVQSEIYESLGYPFTAILSENSPEKFETILRNARNFMESDQFTGNLLALHSWNEWTEGAYLEPDTEYQYKYLEAIKHVFSTQNQSSRETKKC